MGWQDIVGNPGIKVVDANGERDVAVDAGDAAIERAVSRVRQDIDHGYQMCRSDTEDRLARGEPRVLPNVPNKRIDRIANEVVQQAVDAEVAVEEAAE